MNEEEYHTIVLGALLHDIGKFLHRDSRYLKMAGEYQKVSRMFIEDYASFFEETCDLDLLKTIVQRHHEDVRAYPDDLLVQSAPPEYRPLCLLVSIADNLSSNESGKSETRDYKVTPLASVFSRIRISGNKPLPGEMLCYRLSPLDASKAFPERFDKLTSAEVNDHLLSFAKEWELLQRSIKSKDFRVIYSHILTLLHRYTWCVPSDTQQVIPDVSLYDHLRTTSAIAACLYIFHHAAGSRPTEEEIRDMNEEKFILLAGDVSGIQDYIFDFQHVGVGGSAKRLRARSFYVAQVSELACLAILHEFNLPLSNVIMSSGGRFYILLPRVDDAEQRIQKIQREFDTWSLEEMHGRLALHLSGVRLSGGNLAVSESNGELDFASKLTEVNHKLRESKQAPLFDVLCSNGKWDETKFVIEQQAADGGEYCQACEKRIGRRRADEDAIICEHCEQDKLLGRMLPRAKKIAYHTDHTGRFKIALRSFDLLQPGEKPKGNPVLIAAMRVDEPPDVFDAPVVVRPVANHIPIAGGNPCDSCPEKEACEEHPEKGDPLFFKCIAAQAQGYKTLAYLKADVDDLGKIFAFGLPRELRTISRIATLSRMLDLFFAGWVENTIESEFNSIYTVYSGGDDLLLIGPWDGIIKFAAKLNRAFRQFTCHNPDITLSAGIALAKHSTPVMNVVAVADYNLDKLAKEKPMRGEKRSKNQIAVLGEILKWHLLPSALDEAEKLAEWLSAKKLSVAFGRNLLLYAHMYNEFHKDKRKNVRYLKFLPLMTYDTARNLPPPDAKDATEAEIGKWAHELKNRMVGKPHVPVAFVARYALMAVRGGKHNGED